MATKIEWTDETWNPIRGCSRVSEGCRNCYAEKVAYRFSDAGRPYHGLVGIGGKWNGKIKFVEEHLLDPLRWKKPRRIFVNSMSDLFHENVTDAMRDQIFAVMALCPQHTFQVLTKRPERMLAYLTQQASEELQQDGRQLMVEMAIETLLQQAISCDFVKWPLANVWLGVSVEDQKTADERIPLLLQTPAAVRFLSCEPLLGPINLAPRSRLLAPVGHCPGCVSGDGAGPGDHALGSVEHPVNDLDWVIVGGESGPGARPMHPDWARSLRDQCEAAGVPFFFKQWGELAPGAQGAKYGNTKLAMRIDRGGRNLTDLPGLWDASDALFYRVGKKAAWHLLDGKEWRQFPAGSR